MGTDLKNSLQALREIAPNLNKMSDEAAKIIRETERALQELNLGIAAEVVVSSENKSSKVTEWTSLAFKRAPFDPGEKTLFRVMVVEERSTDFGDDRNFSQRAWKITSETPWLECSRDVKLATFPKLPALLEELIKVAKESLST